MIHSIVTMMIVMTMMATTIMATTTNTTPDLKQLIHAALQPQEAHRQERITKAPTSYLRSTSNIEAEGNTLSGWYETVTYANSNCSKPTLKTASILNTCGLSSEGGSVKITAVANSSKNQYTMTEYDYSGTTCGSLTETAIWYEPILICTDYELVHVINAPLNASTDNLGGLAIGVYTNQQDCTGNSADDYHGLLEYVYFKENYCYRAGLYLNADSWDYKFVSCSPTAGFTYTVYASADGSCTGTAENFTYTPSQMCQNNNWDLAFFAGWPNYVCEGQ